MTVAVCRPTAAYYKLLSMIDMSHLTFIELPRVDYSVAAAVAATQLPISDVSQADLVQGGMPLNDKDIKRRTYIY